MKLKMFFYLLAVALILGSCQEDILAPQEPEHATATIMGTGTVAKGYIVVKFTDNTPKTKSITTTLPDMQISSIQRLFTENPRFAKRHKEAGLDRWYVISFNPEIPLSTAYAQFKSLEDVSIVEFLTIAQYASTDNTFPFNDPYLKDQWHYNNTVQKAGFVRGMDMNLFKAWEIETGDPSVIVAVLDGGIDFRHKDLANTMWVNEAEKNGKPGVDDDGNGYKDDVYGYSFFVDSDGSIEPSDHGTHVAGTVAAINNNGAFGCGVAGGDGTNPGVRLMSCATIENNRSAYIGNAFIYACDNGAVITQNSWGFVAGTVSSTPQFVIDAFEYFNTYAGFDEYGNQVGPMAGGICIFAAGNDNVQVGYPAVEEQVFAVAATGPTGKRSSYSNYGSWVEISAPGGENRPSPIGNVFSTLPNGSFGEMSGTSMACPHVSGVAALILSKFGGPGFTNKMLWDRLIACADYDKLYNSNKDYIGKLGAGALDAYKALMDSQIPDAVESVDAEVSSNSITINWEATATNGEPTYGYNIFCSKNDLSNYNPEEGNIEPIFVAGESYKVGDVITYTLTNLDFNTNYYIRIQAINIFKTGSALSPQVKVLTQDNLPPVITPGDDITTTLKSFETATYTFTISDPENGEINYTLDDNSGAVSVRRKNNTLTVTIEAPKANAGSYKAKLTIEDEIGSTDDVEINFTILPNTPPVKVKDIENTILDKGESITLNLSEYFSDNDGEQLNYDIIVTGSATYAIEGNTFTLNAPIYGTSTVSITAYDAKMERTQEAEFKLVVRDKKQPLDVFPTNVTTSFNVRTATNSTVDIIVTSASGATVFSASGIAAGPFNPYTIDTTEWGAGIYSVQITDNGTKHTRTIVKM